MHPRLLVLLVEDDADEREAMCESLEVHGFEVVGAADAARALSAVRTRAPAAVVLDLELPDAAGEDLARELRLQPGMGDVAMFALSGRRVRAEALTSGVFAVCLHKPIDVRFLAAELRRHLRTNVVPT